MHACVWLCVWLWNVVGRSVAWGCSRPLADGDVVAIDVSCFLNGYHGDNCRTFIAGQGTPAAVRLVEGTWCVGASDRRPPATSCAPHTIRLCCPPSATREQ
jgi:hypothetical protein